MTVKNGPFLGLHISQKVPDTTSIWRFREDLVKAGIVEELFANFDAHLRTNGFTAMKGQIVDASIVNVLKQRNSREDWSENKQRRKDVDARWTKKNGKSFYGYKNHVSVDVKHKLIRPIDRRIGWSGLRSKVFANTSNARGAAIAH